MQRGPGNSPPAFAQIDMRSSPALPGLPLLVFLMGVTGLDDIAKAS